MQRLGTARDATGVTLVELLVVLALAALLGMLATPTFRDLGANARRDARLDALRSTLQLARAEALARGVPVVVCASADGHACTASPRWSDGWIAYPRTPDAADVPAAVLAARGPDASTRVHGNRTSIVFQPTAAAATTATLTVCDHRGARTARALVVSRTGRLRVERAGALRCG